MSRITKPRTNGKLNQLFGSVAKDSTQYPAQADTYVPEIDQFDKAFKTENGDVIFKAGSGWHFLPKGSDEVYKLRAKDDYQNNTLSILDDFGTKTEATLQYDPEAKNASITADGETKKLTFLSESEKEEINNLIAEKNMPAIGMPYQRYISRAYQFPDGGMLIVSENHSVRSSYSSEGLYKDCARIFKGPDLDHLQELEMKSLRILRSHEKFTTEEGTLDILKTPPHVEWIPPGGMSMQEARRLFNENAPDTSKELLRLQLAKQHLEDKVDWIKENARKAQEIKPEPPASEGMFSGLKKLFKIGSDTDKKQDIKPSAPDPDPLSEVNKELELIAQERQEIENPDIRSMIPEEGRPIALTTLDVNAIAKEIGSSNPDLQGVQTWEEYSQNIGPN